MAEEVQYGIWFGWTDTAPEWLCDHAGVVFVFEKKYEAEAIKDLLHPGNGTAVEVKPYHGEAETRPYPWPDEINDQTIPNLQVQNS